MILKTLKTIAGMSALLGFVGLNPASAATDAKTKSQETLQELFQLVQSPAQANEQMIKSMNQYLAKKNASSDASNMPASYSAEFDRDWAHCSKRKWNANAFKYLPKALSGGVVTVDFKDAANAKSPRCEKYLTTHAGKNTVVLDRYNNFSVTAAKKAFYKASYEVQIDLATKIVTKLKHVSTDSSESALVRSVALALLEVEQNYGASLSGASIIQDTVNWMGLIADNQRTIDLVAASVQKHIEETNGNPDRHYLFTHELHSAQAYR